MDSVSLRPVWAGGKPNETSLFLSDWPVEHVPCRGLPADPAALPHSLRWPHPHAGLGRLIQLTAQLTHLAEEGKVPAPGPQQWHCSHPGQPGLAHGRHSHTISLMLTPTCILLIVQCQLSFRVLLGGLISKSARHCSQCVNSPERQKQQGRTEELARFKADPLMGEGGH